MRLRGGVGLLPGGIQFIDPRIPVKQWLDDHTFLNERVREVFQFRALNPVIYPPSEPQYLNAAYIENEIVIYNANRLRNDPNYFYDESYAGPSISPSLNIPADRNCDVCGVILTPRYCPTCSGQKINGYNCSGCGKVY